MPRVQAARLRQLDAAAQAKVAAVEKELARLPTRQDLNDAQKMTEETRLQEELAAAREEQIEAYRTLRNTSPAYRLMLGKDFQPVKPDALQAWVKGQNALLLQYFFEDKNGYVFIIDPTGGLRIVSLEVSEALAKDLGTEAGPLTAAHLKAVLSMDGRDLPARLAQADDDQGLTQRLAALWKLLIPEDCQNALATGKYQQLIVVPDGALANLPLMRWLSNRGTSRFICWMLARRLSKPLRRLCS